MAKDFTDDGRPFHRASLVDASPLRWSYRDGEEGTQLPSVSRALPPCRNPQA